MQRCLCTQSNRPSAGSVATPQRGFENASDCERSQRDDSSFNEIDVLDALVGLVQHRTLFQRDRFKKRANAIKIRQRKTLKNAIFYDRTSMRGDNHGL